MIDNDSIRQLLDRGDPQALRQALAEEPELANRTVHWYQNQQNSSDPLHYVSDCVALGWLDDRKAAVIAALLIEHGAAVNGSGTGETPLLGATSLGADSVADVLIEAGATLENTSVFGARALHWAAWMGASRIVAQLIAHGAEIEPRCTEFGATPLFWAVHGYGPRGPRTKSDQVGAATHLVRAGARVDTANRNGRSVLEQARLCARDDMYALLSSQT